MSLSKKRHGRARMVLLPVKVRITLLQILRALDTERLDDQVLLASKTLILSKGLQRLLTKTGTLRQALGDAHKGWSLREYHGDAGELLKKFKNKNSVKLLFHRRSLASKKITHRKRLKSSFQTKPNRFFNWFVNSSTRLSIRQQVRQFVNEFVISSTSSSTSSSMFVNLPLKVRQY